MSYKQEHISSKPKSFMTYGAVVETCLSAIPFVGIDYSPLMDISDTKFWLAVLNKNKGEPNPDLSSLVSFSAQSTKRI